jgi:biofilm PGA synthesis lipoprotein PgaB
MYFLNKKRFLPLILLLVFLPSKGKAAFEKPYLNDVGQFNYASFLRKEGDFKRAAREFERVIEQFPTSPLIPEAHFRLADSYLDAGDFREAIDQFRQFLENFKESPFADEAELKLLKAERFFARIKEPEGKVEEPVFEARKEVEIPAPAGPKPRSSLRAVQFMLFNAKSYAEIEEELKSLKRAGVDTIIVRVFHNRGDRCYSFVKPLSPVGVYFRTTHAPVVADILPKVLTIAHKNGLRVFAWMTTRYADYGLEDRPDLACKGYDLSERKMVRCRGFDIFNESAVRHLEGLYSDLASYAIDGILFQDDLVLRHNEGFGGYAEALFKRDRGGAMDPEKFYLRSDGSPYVRYTPSFWEWAAWKNKRLLKVAERLRRVARERNPGIKFAINLMYESVMNPPYALAWLSQDLASAAKTGFDYYSIMAYHRQMSEELDKGPQEVKELIERMVEEAARIVGEPHKVLIKLQTIDWNTQKPVSNGELAALIRSIRSIEDVSLAVVPYRADFPFYELGKRTDKALVEDRDFGKGVLADGN